MAQTQDNFYVDFPDYEVSLAEQVPLVGKVKSRLGHAMVIARDPNTNRTCASEYGRYNSNRGNAQRVKVPDFQGDPTNEEDTKRYAQRVLASYQRNMGADKVGNTIKLTYVPDVDYNQTVQAMQNAERNGLKRDYSWLGGITCGSYAHNLAVGDDASDREFGTPSQAAPSTIFYPGRYRVKYTDETQSYRNGGNIGRPRLVPRRKSTKF